MTDTPTVSTTCQVLVNWDSADDGKNAVPCNVPTAFYCRTPGGGTMALCAKHGSPHRNYATGYSPSASALTPVLSLVPRDV